MVLALKKPVSQGSQAQIQNNAASGLTAFIAQRLAEDDVRLLSCIRLEGGAVQENWRLVVGFSRNGEPQREHYVLRTSAKTHLPDSRPKAQEFEILRTAWDAGVLVPEPLWLCVDHSVIGADFFISREVPGRARGQDIIALNRPEDGNPALLKDLGEQLAKTHNIKSLPEELSFLLETDSCPALRAVHHWRRELDSLTGSWPALEWGLRWCENHLPEAPREHCLLHGDFRTGNYLVDDSQHPQGRLSAVLDWEFAQWGDPMSDIGWFCAACWRFDRQDLEAGGIGTRAAFYHAYEKAAGHRVDAASVHFWEILSHIRWAIIACQQGDRFFAGGEDTLDLALTGRLRPAQVQKHLLEMTAPENWKKGRVKVSELETSPEITGNARNGHRPDETAKMLESAAKLFHDEIEPALPEGQRAKGRMITDALACVLLDLKRQAEPAGGHSDRPESDSTWADSATQQQATALHLDQLERISTDLKPEREEKKGITI